MRNNHLNYLEYGLWINLELLEEQEIFISYISPQWETKAAYNNPFHHHNHPVMQVMIKEVTTPRFCSEPPWQSENFN